jgi:hypothetical protein
MSHNPMGLHAVTGIALPLRVEAIIASGRSRWRCVKVYGVSPVAVITVILIITSSAATSI